LRTGARTGAVSANHIRGNLEGEGGKGNGNAFNLENGEKSLSEAHIQNEPAEGDPLCGGGWRMQEGKEVATFIDKENTSLQMRPDVKKKTDR